MSGWAAAPPCPVCGARNITWRMWRLPWRRGQWWRCFGCFYKWCTEAGES